MYTYINYIFLSLFLYLSLKSVNSINYINKIDIQDFN